MEFRETKVSRFDQVRLLTTKNVTYLSAPPGTVVSPEGLWSVTAIVGDDELLLAKQSVLIRIPAIDVLVVAEYSVDKITENLGRLSRGQGKKDQIGTSKGSGILDQIDRESIRSGSDNEGSQPDS